jgi:hypothetical protein
MTTDEAVAHYGTKLAIAKAININPAAVAQWGEFPPPLRQFQMHFNSKKVLKVETSAMKG